MKEEDLAKVINVRSRVSSEPSIGGSLILISSALFSSLYVDSSRLPSELAAEVSLIWLVALGLALLVEGRSGVRTLFRADLIALCSLYFLLYFEFLFPQAHFDTLVLSDDAVSAIRSTQLGLIALVLGRHLPFRLESLNAVKSIEIRPAQYVLLLVIGFCLAHLPMCLAVGFDVRQLWMELLGPRFGRSWGRGRYGDFATLLHELQLFGYVVPPIAGVVLSKWRHIGGWGAGLVALLLSIHLFLAFSSGTRNILAIYLASFLVGYFLARPKVHPAFIGTSCAVVGLAFLMASAFMLQFREYGLRDWMRSDPVSQRTLAASFMGNKESEEVQSGFLVDYNLWRLAQMRAAFPAVHPYLGLNVPYVALTKPIPRALWTGKPLGLKVALESVIGAEGYTIACTWIGEAHVAGGPAAILIIGMGIGLFCRTWTTLLSEGSNFSLLVYASGVYAVLLLMRSLMFFTTALLPSLALLGLGLLIHSSRHPAEAKTCPTL